MKKQHAKLTDHANQRHGNLQQTLDKLDDLYKSVAKANGDIDGLVDILADQKPIGGEIKAIQQQQDEFKVRFYNNRDISIPLTQ